MWKSKLKQEMPPSLDTVLKALLQLSRPAVGATGFARCCEAAGYVLLLLSFLNCAWAGEHDEAVDALLKKADRVKTSNYAEFTELLKTANQQADEISKPHQQYLSYLNGWKLVYDGQYSAAITALKPIARESSDRTLQFRAGATVANTLILTKQYDEAFSELGRVLAMLEEISDVDARIQALSIAASLYNEVGDYDLGIYYAEKLIAQTASAKSVCNGKQLKLDALHKSSQLRLQSAELQDAVDSCAKVGEVLYANLIRTYLASLHMEQGNFDEAIRLLNEYYDEVVSTKYPRLTSQYDALLAQAYQNNGNATLAKRFALHATDDGARNDFTRPQIAAYRLLYDLAKSQGDIRSALSYYERYSAADKGYLNDVSARQLAYQRVKHQVDAGKLQINSLNKENEVLHLQRSLSDKAVETSRLYIVMLVMGLAFVAFMAYRTKRSQMHFMNLSRLDGLTGLTNRPHFLELADNALKESQRTGKSICVIICDLDYFKRINDTCGHAAGDTALKKTATVFRAHLRDQDIVGRLGGEEFGMVLIDCDAATALARCDEIRVAIATILISNETTEFQLAASLGIATTALSGHELRQLLADADTALYEAKRTGRNRIVQHGIECISQESPPPTVLDQLSA
jgi:diguanylate cyclase (GGDEF)-like protein